ncbi:hypothetical protein EX30DRAFT_341946 [Ascodesmis nigricans]|uniref:Uncharacterized protein n=1 Tax=Ascodesmis nigricans TaxID=341454 RepID=A0A4S2MTP3_9PEZI|nr:hypothetical protein EX30DRAFT_341946 [Ascodesmis nigricans]
MANLHQTPSSMTPMRASSLPSGTKTSGNADRKRKPAEAVRNPDQLPQNCNLCHLVQNHYNSPDPPPPRLLRLCRFHELSRSTSNTPYPITPAPLRSADEHQLPLNPDIAFQTPRRPSAPTPTSTAYSSPFTPYPQTTPIPIILHPSSAPQTPKLTATPAPPPLPHPDLPQLPTSPLLKHRKSFKSRPTQLTPSPDPASATPQTWITIRPSTAGVVRVSSRSQETFTERSSHTLSRSRSRGQDTIRLRPAPSVSSVRSGASTIRVVRAEDDADELRATRTRTRTPQRHGTQRQHSAKKGSTPSARLSAMKKALQRLTTPSPRKYTKTPTTTPFSGRYEGPGRRNLEPRFRAEVGDQRVESYGSVGRGGRRDLKGVLVGVANRLRISPGKMRSPGLGLEG